MPTPALCPPCFLVLWQAVHLVDMYRCEILAKIELAPFAVFLGTFTLLAVRFHGLQPWAGFLLLPFLGYSVFGAALLNLSLRSGNAEVSAPSSVMRKQDQVVGERQNQATDEVCLIPVLSRHTPASMCTTEPITRRPVTG